MEWYRLKSNPLCCPENVVQGLGYRITILTECLLRLEYSEYNQFEDRATQVVMNRDFTPVSFQVLENEENLEIITNRLHIVYNRKPFSQNGLSIRQHGNSATSGYVWKFGQPNWNLGGTVRTLDGVDGACGLGDGLMAMNGCTILDDSKSLLIQDNGWIGPRSVPETDIYFFGYGHEYRRCLVDFYHLCGKTPMIPRYALGNWWSRYYKYTEESYKELMNRFQQENVPFSIAVIDMDWHLVDIDPKYGSGWTGYTWNREFFPDPEGFLNWLHKRGMKVTLNIHPADGIRGHEEMYPPMAEAMGLDPEKEEPVYFDIASERFLSAYFQYVNHPYEEKGVDFWWLDWQQGISTKLEGLDPLWMLNHYHYLDAARSGKRPMTFSRYAGPGSHRYPIGFSGDTMITWASLDFQPYFTSTASNIGYGWWSHDIGGHMGGIKIDEMEARWYQYGVFSPVNRLHSSNNPFSGKEPWRFRADVRVTMGRFLRLRHAMVPYLYTMNYRAYKEDLPMVQPMYYEYPEIDHAYAVKNQYFFGTEFMVAPITTPIISGINRAKVKVWLPKGNWNDFFTGMHYVGGCYVWMYRNIQSIPVLSRDGAIIPMTSEISAAEVAKNPKHLKVRIYGGADGAFTLYEDENDTTTYEKGVCVTTNISLNWNHRVITIKRPQGNLTLIPQMRQWTVELAGVTKGAVTVLANGMALAAEVSYENTYEKLQQMLIVSLPELPVDTEIHIVFDENVKKGDNQIRERIFELLNEAEISFDLKASIYNTVGHEERLPQLLSTLMAMELPEDLFRCILELYQ